MDSKQERDKILTNSSIRELSNADFMVQALMSFSQELYEEMVLITRNTYIKTATSNSQIIDLAHNLNYNPRRLETYKVNASISVSDLFPSSSEYLTYLTYNEGDIVRFDGNLYLRKLESIDPVLGVGWELTGDTAPEDITLPIYTKFSAGNISYYNVDIIIISKGKTYSEVILYEGLYRSQTTDILNVSELVELEGVSIASKTLKVMDIINNIEVNIIEDLGELPPDFNAGYALTQETSGVIIYNFEPTKNIISDKTITWVESTRQDGFVGSNVLTTESPLFVYHGEAYGYVMEEQGESIKGAASSGLSGRSLTSLNKSLNFLKSYYNYSSISETAVGGVLYVAVSDNKDPLTSDEVLNLKREVNRNRPIGASIEYEDSYIINVVLLANIRLRVGTSKNELLNRAVIEDFDKTLNFGKPFRVYEFVNRLYEENLAESSDIFPGVIFNIPVMQQGDSSYVETRVPLSEVEIKLITENNEVLSLSNYSLDVEITYETDFSGVQIKLLTPRFAGKKLKLFVGYNLVIPIPDDITIFKLEPSLSYSLWSFE